jgi:hypothetical protein
MTARSWSRPPEEMLVRPKNEGTKVFPKRILYEVEALDPLKPKYDVPFP